LILSAKDEKELLEILASDEFLATEEVEKSPTKYENFYTASRA